ncbi:MAG: LamG domain-containing protein [Candidatus Margulisiibacteriota bacterium]
MNRSSRVTKLLHLGIILILFIVGSLSFAAVKTPSLVGAWRFEGNANDWSGNGNNGTVNGAVLATERVYSTKQGTISASMADTIAFINDDGQTFTSYAGAAGVSKPYKIILTDSVGKKAWGYIGEQGTGETLGSNLVVNGDNEAALMSNVSSLRGSLSQSSEQKYAGSYSAKYICDSQIGAHYTITALVLNKLYKTSQYVYLPSGQTTTYLSIGAWAGPVNYGIGYTSLTDQWVLLSGYANATASYIGIMSNVNTCNNEFWYIDNAVVQQVLTPTTAGVKIYSTQTGSTQSWASVESGFNANLISSYEIKQTEAGKFGQCYSFDGDYDYLGNATPNLVTGNNPFTKAVWIKSFYKGSITNHPDIISWGDNLANKKNGLALITDVSGNPQVMQWFFANDYKWDVTDLTGSWHYLVVTYQSPTLELFIDGVSQGTKTVTGAPDVQNTKLNIGGFFTSPYFFNGLIDEIRVYNRVLSSAEIRSLMLNYDPGEF